MIVPSLRSAVTLFLYSEMLKKLGYETLDQLTDAAVPEGIKLKRDLNLSPPISEVEAIRKIKAIASKNKVSLCCIRFEKRR